MKHETSGSIGPYSSQGRSQPTLPPARIARTLSSVQASYEHFDHTADMGIRVRAADLPQLLAPAAKGLYAAIGSLEPGVESERVSIELTGAEPAVLLRDYLNELLILFERDGRIVTTIDEADFTNDRLAVTARTALIDEERSALHREVKAITYHELAIREVAGGFEATLIVDI